MGDYRHGSGIKRTLRNWRVRKGSPATKAIWNQLSPCPGGGHYRVSCTWSRYALAKVSIGVSGLDPRRFIML
jgi:hypothetical protein